MRECVCGSGFNQVCEDDLQGRKGALGAEHSQRRFRLSQYSNVRLSLCLKAFADLDRNVRRGIFDYVVPKPGDLQGRARSRRVVHWMLALSCTHNAEPQAQHRRDTTLLRNIVAEVSSDPSSKETGQTIHPYKPIGFTRTRSSTDMIYALAPPKKRALDARCRGARTR